jgi:hypothetical protein
MWEMPKPNKAQTYFINLGEKLKSFKVETLEDSAGYKHIEIFDLKNGVIIVKEYVPKIGSEYSDTINIDEERFFYSIIKDSKLANKKESREVLKKLTGKEPPKQLGCDYKGIRLVKFKEKIITEKREYPSTRWLNEYQPNDEEIKDQLGDIKGRLNAIKNDFGLKNLPVEEMKQKAEETLSYFSEKQ